MKKGSMFALAAVTAVVALFTVGVGGAAAHGGGGKGGRFGQVGTSALVNAAASQLGVTSAKLKSAIVDAAVAQINAAADDEDITADEAADLKEEAQDNLNVAYSLSRASVVASNVGVTTTKLNDAFRAARKTLITKKIDAALAAGDITADQAADLKDQLASTTLPGYKQSGLGLGLGLGGPGGGQGHGFGR